MKSLAIYFFFLLAGIHIPSDTDQIHDYLIIENDTIFLKSFPLEMLGFESRPFKYGRWDYPGPHCWRGYQATWRVIDKKLYLASMVKVNAPDEKLDMVKYFEDNGYTPTIQHEMIFADWVSLNLSAFPVEFKYWGCEWENKRPKKQKVSIRFEEGILVLNKYKARKTGSHAP